MTERVTATTILNPHTAHRQSKVESTTGGDAAGNEVKNTTEKKEHKKRQKQNGNSL